MRKFFVGIGLSAVIIVAGAVIYLWGYLPRYRPAPDLNITYTPELVAKGDYMVNEVLLCFDCHSPRDWTQYSGPAIAPLGAGRPCIDENSKPVGIKFGSGGFPGRLCIRNITMDEETGIGAWTDGEIARAIREGISRDGEALFPIMPWFMYTEMTDEDVSAVIAYLRTIEPVKSFRPERTLDFPLNVLTRLYPEPLDGPIPPMDTTDTAVYGRYLTKIARCEFCHTPRVRRSVNPIPGRLMAGGVPFFMGTELHYSKNLTPHEDGMGNWTKEMFIQRFRVTTKPFPVREEDNSEMNWVEFSGMSDADLGAIWDYLQTLEAKETILLGNAE